MEPSDHRSSRTLVGSPIANCDGARFDETLEGSNGFGSDLVGAGVVYVAIDNERSLIRAEGPCERITP
jgi:hypothetical protein